MNWDKSKEAVQNTGKHIDLIMFSCHVCFEQARRPPPQKRNTVLITSNLTSKYIFWVHSTTSDPYESYYTHQGKPIFCSIKIFSENLTTPNLFKRDANDAHPTPRSTYIALKRNDVRDVVPRNSTRAVKEGKLPDVVADDNSLHDEPSRVPRNKTIDAGSVSDSAATPPNIHHHVPRNTSLNASQIEMYTKEAVTFHIFQWQASRRRKRDIKSKGVTCPHLSRKNLGNEILWRITNFKTKSEFIVPTF